jgi:hypothetical protein
MKTAWRVFCGLLLSAITAAQAQSYTTGSGIVYTINGSTIAVTGYSGSGGALTIPDTIGGTPVTSIGYQAFDNNTSITSITIGTNVTSIAEYAFFSCSSMTSASISASVTSIGEEAFADSPSLGGITVDANNPSYTSVNGVVFDKSQTTIVAYPAGKGGTYTLPGSVTAIGAGAFGYANLTAFTIPSNVITIGNDAFEWCIHLTNVTIPNGVTSLGADAFEGCYYLPTVAIPASVTSIGDSAFSECSLKAINVDSNNPAYSSVSGVLFDKAQTTLLQYPTDNGATSYTIPSTVTSIGYFAFENVLVSNLTIPDSVTNIAEEAFYGGFLPSLTIPDSVTSIGSGAFYYCVELTNVTIGAGVTNLGDGAFYDCSRLVGVYFRGSAPSANSGVFGDDGDLIAVYFLPGTTGWGGTFAGITAVELGVNFTVTAATWPGGAGIVTGGGSFASGSWQTVGVTQNSGYTFVNWTANGGVVSGNTSYTFMVTTNLNLVANFSFPATLAVSASPTAGGTVGGGGTFTSGTSQTVTASANSGYAFANWTANGSVVSWDANYTFTLPTNLTLVANFIANPPGYQIAVSNGTITITHYSGSGGALTLPSSISGLPVTGIGLNAFYEVNSLTSVTIPASVTNIDGCPFSDCILLNSITVDPGNPAYTSVNGILFDKTQTALIQYPPHKSGTSYAIPSGITSIGDDAFAESDYLTSITIPDGVTNIGNGAFYFTQLSSVTIPNSVTTIGEYAFEECTLLSTVTMGTGVAYIEDYAFSECGNLSAVYFFGPAPSMGGGAFHGDGDAQFYYLAGISTQPAGETVVLAGSSATFTAAASGTPSFPPAYQWQLSTDGGATWNNLTNGNGITGALTGTLTIGNTTSSMSGNQLRVIVTNSAGQFTSNTSTLTVLTPVQLSFNNFLTLEVPGATSTYANGISGGEVVGYYSDTNDTIHGFLYDIAAQTYTTLDAPGAQGWYGSSYGTYFTGISGSNVVGYCNTYNGQSGFLYNMQTQSYITPALPSGYFGSYVTGTFGDYIVGYYIDIDWTAHGYLYDIAAQSYTTLDDPQAERGFDYDVMGTYAAGISGGTVAGYYVTNGSGGGFLYNITNQTYTSLYFPGVGVYTGDVNGIDGNNIIGENSAGLPYIYNDAALTFATLAYTVSGISGNNVVGSYDAGTTNVGFLATLVETTNAVLTVTTSGGGSVYPDDDGDSLQVGNDYSITATAGTGFVFTNWTGGTSLPLVVLTNGLTLQFVMEQNLMLQANFVDTAPPELTITSPSPGEHWSSAAFTITGTATDNAAVAGVFYSLNGAGWSSAGTGNGWANWSAAVTLIQGTNTLAAYAVDTSGNISPTNTLSFVYVIVPPATCTVTLSPSPLSGGKVTGAGTYKTGTSRSVSATAGTGYVFADWTENGSVVATSATYSFTLSSDRTLVANFVPNPFTAVAGNYAGLFYDTNSGSVTVSNAGYFTAKVTASGSFSASLQESDATVSFSGQFSPGGLWQTNSIKGAPGLSASLRLNLSGGNEIAGMIGNALWTAEVTANRSVYSKANPAPWAGQYTLVISGSLDFADLPGGNGAAAVTVSALGAITVSGTLGDGSTVTESTFVSEQGQWPLYSSLYSKKGLMLGWLTFTNDVAETNDLEGTVAWIKPGGTGTKLYPNGFTWPDAPSYNAFGSAFTNQTPLMDWSNGVVILQEGNLAQSITNGFEMGSNGKVTGAGGLKLTLTTSGTKAGLFSGSVLNPATKKAVSFNGALLQNQNIGRGVFVGTNQSGSVVVGAP